MTRVTGAVYWAMARALLVVLGLAALLVSPAAAQAERWQVTLEGDQYVWDVRLMALEGDSLVLLQADTVRRVPVAAITEVRLIRKSEVQLGAGATAGAMNALTGGDDEIYDLTPLDFAGRLRAVQKIFLYHPPESQ